MNRRAFLAGSLFAAGCRSQEPQSAAIPFICPMDPDVRSVAPAKCPKCGMALVAGIPDPVEFDVRMRTTPAAPLPNSPVTLHFNIYDPRTSKPANLQIIHEKLFHLFLVSQDLQYFAHEHPEQQSDGSFVFRTKLPTGGEYRVLCDFYPEKATPQMIAKTLILPGKAVPPRLVPNTVPEGGENLKVRLRLDPPQPLAGKKTMLFYTLDPFDGIEPYLGAWGHMLAASEDLIDVIHTHPAWEDRNATVQFNLIFPRPGIYRVWAQFQRKGVVNTVAVNVPVQAI